uniref:Serpin domain-containing protein n=1 Tax=Panagrolaimus sp. JU765 TaxID=591449 RepID=A0AC34R5M8_9BILA
MTEEEIHEYFSNVWTNLKTAKDISILPILKLFISKEFDFLEDYKGKIEKFYQGSSEKIDFENPEVAMKKINDFVMNSTEGNITELVKKEYFDNQSRISLISTLYFDAKWRYPFDPENTKPGTFYISENKKTEIEMMWETDFYYQKFCEDYRVLKLRFDNPKFAMFIVLPKKQFGLSEVLRKLDKKNLMELFEIEKDEFCPIAIPKIKIENDCDFTEILKEKGIVDLFDLEKSDISQICTEKEIKLNLVKQKSFILVNEEGVKAAAATFEDLRGYGMPIPIEPFIADHPFCYFIVEKSENNDFNVLFAGTVVEPVKGVFETDKNLTKSEMDFALDFFKRDFTENSVISPIGLFANLAAVGIGADKETSEKIFKFISKSDSPMEIHKFLRQNLKPTEECYGGEGDISVLFKIWMDKNVKIDDEFSDGVKRYYPEGLKQIDFSKNLNEEISTFFKNSPKTTEEFDFSAIPGMILTSTIVPDLGWVYGSRSEGSEFPNFLIDENTTKNVRMIKFYCPDYGAEKDYHFFEMEFDRQVHYLYILFPKQKFDLKNVLENLETSVLSKFIGRHEKSTKNVEISKIIQNLEIKLTNQGIGRPGSEIYGNLQENSKNNEEIIKVDNPFAYFVIRKPDYHYYRKIRYFQVIFAGIVADPISSI